MSQKQPDAPMQPSTPERHAPGTRDAQGRLLCTSRRSKGRGPCDGPAITGLDKCKMHVGVTVEQARRQVQEAIGLLAAQALGIAWEMIIDRDTPPAVRATLLRDALDRAGHGAARQVDVTHRDLTDAAVRAAEAATVRDELSERRERNVG